MSVDELEAIKAVTEELNSQIGDTMTLCLFANEQRDYDEMQKHLERLRHYREVMKELKAYMTPVFTEVMKGQVIH